MTSIANCLANIVFLEFCVYNGPTVVHLCIPVLLLTRNSQMS